MAINRRALMGEGGQRSGTISARGVRSVTTKDSIALTKTLKSINMNLVSINKLLQKNALDESKRQEESTRKKRKAEEGLRRESKESGLEKSGKSLLMGVGGVIGKLKDTLVNTSKGILGKILDVAKPFIQFFTLGFIGWFSGKVAKWFDENKEDRKKKIKSFIPKILSALTIAGGVLLAIKFGIPVIMGLIGTIVGMIPVVIGALLNPATWVALLATGAAVFAFELGSGLKEAIDPGQRARERIRSLTGARDFTTESLDLETKSSKIQGQGGRTQREFVKLGDRYYLKRDIDKLFQSQDEFDQQIYFYKMGRQGATKVGGEQVNLQTLREGKVLSGITRELRSNIIDQRIKSRLGVAYKEYAKQRNEILMREERIKDKQKLMQQYPDKEGTLTKEIEDLRKEIAGFQNNMEFAGKEVTRLYANLDAQSKEKLRTVAGITEKNLLSSFALTESETLFQAKKAGAQLQSAVMGAADPYLRQATSMMTGLKADLSAKIDNLFDGGSKVDVNLNIKQTMPDMAYDDPTEIPVPGNMSPYDLTSPWLQHATKVYGVSPVGV